MALTRRECDWPHCKEDVNSPPPGDVTKMYGLQLCAAHYEHVKTLFRQNTPLGKDWWLTK